MIDMEKAELNGKPIKTWAVWFRTILGLHKTVEEAQQVALAVDMPIQLIRPVPVALDEDGNYEESTR